jgi:hypothetical protein
MTLNDLLRSDNIDPETVVVMRHRPQEGELNKVLPWLAAERPDVFNAYQQTQGEKVEQALGRANYVASFIGHEAGKAMFVGLFAIGKSKPVTRDEFWRVPANQELKAFGMRGFDEQIERKTMLCSTSRGSVSAQSGRANSSSGGLPLNARGGVVPIGTK